MTILPAQSDLQMRTEYEAMGAHLNRNSTRSQTELDRSWRTGRPPNPQCAAIDSSRVRVEVPFGRLDDRSPIA